jgi:DNA invertase Pin-like site-specific DNA recombinase
MNNQYVAYYRVSTQKQNLSHLGMEAQRKMCNDFVNTKSGVIVKEFEDVESGKSRTREGLWQAIEFCKEHNYPLVIGKLDRLARDVEFTFKVINTGVEIHFTDMPMVNTMILGVFASVAQYERELVSIRTKQALAAKKARGETWVRNSDTTKAIIQSAKNKIARAKANPTNVFFYNYVMQFEKRNGRLDPKDKEGYQKLADELNGLGQKTVTGLPYTKTRCQGLVIKMRKRFKC